MNLSIIVTQLEGEFHFDRKLSSDEIKGLSLCLDESFVVRDQGKTLCPWEDISVGEIIKSLEKIISYLESITVDLNGLIAYGMEYEYIDYKGDDINYGYISVDKNKLFHCNFRPDIKESIRENNLPALSQIIGKLRSVGIKKFISIIGYIESKYESDEKYYQIIKYLVENSTENINGHVISPMTLPKHNLEFLKFIISNLQPNVHALLHLKLDKKASPEIRNYLISSFNENLMSADPSTKINNLMIAAAQGHRDKINIYLSEAQYFPVSKFERYNQADIFGNVALHYAANNGHIEIFCILVVNQGAFRKKNKAKKIPLDYLSDYNLIKMMGLWYASLEDKYMSINDLLEKYVSRRFHLNLSSLRYGEKYKRIKNKFKKRITSIKGTYLSPEIVPRDILNLVGEMLFYSC